MSRRAAAHVDMAGGLPRRGVVCEGLLEGLLSGHDPPDPSVRPRGASWCPRPEESDHTGSKHMIGHRGRSFDSACSSRQHTVLHIARLCRRPLHTRHADTERTPRATAICGMAAELGAWQRPLAFCPRCASTVCARWQCRGEAHLLACSVSRCPDTARAGLPVLAASLLLGRRPYPRGELAACRALCLLRSAAEWNSTRALPVRQRLATGHIDLKEVLLVLSGQDDTMHRAPGETKVMVLSLHRVPKLQNAATSARKCRLVFMRGYSCTAAPPLSRGCVSTSACRRVCRTRADREGCFSPLWQVSHKREAWAWHVRRRCSLTACTSARAPGSASLGSAASPSAISLSVAAVLECTCTCTARGQPHDQLQCQELASPPAREPAPRHAREGRACEDVCICEEGCD